MPDLFFADLVRETSETSGTGALVLTGATAGHRAFAGVVPEGATFHYAIAGITHEEEWEIGGGTLDASGALVRNALRSSDGGGPCDLSEGLKTVALVVASDWFAAQGEAGALTIADIQGLTDALADKQPLGNYATDPHGHDMGAIDFGAGSDALALDDSLAVKTGGGAAKALSGEAVFARRSAGAPYEAASDVLVNGATVGLGGGANTTNIAFGYQAMAANDGGLFNVALGREALKVSVSGSGNLAVGYQALRDLVDGANNVAFGRLALHKATSASNNIGVGFQALSSSLTGSSSIAIGYQSLSKATDNANLSVGYQSATNIVSGSFNTFVGYRAGYSLTDGSNNTILGGWMGVASLSDTIVLASGATERFRITAASARPGSDNAMALGEASYRFAQLYAGSGSINTSDERVKRDVGAIPDDWLDAWGDVAWSRYRFVDGSRWHIGLVAQRVRDAFAARGLDATGIGLLCFDSWDDAFEPEIGEDGEPTGGDRLVRAAGDRWGLRYEECFAMEAAWVRRELGRRPLP